MATPYLGQIMTVGFNFAPRGYAFCDGQILPIAQNTALFSLLGTTYGGDGRTTFALPDLRSRVAIHVGNGPGLSSYRWGQRGGVETVTLTTAQMPAHTHSPLMCETEPGDAITPVNHVWASDPTGSIPLYSDQTANGSMKSGSVGNNGGSQSHTNRAPFTTISFCIATQGVFPSRS